MSFIRSAQKRLMQVLVCLGKSYEQQASSLQLFCVFYPPQIFHDAFFIAWIYHDKNGFICVALEK